MMSLQLTHAHSLGLGEMERLILIDATDRQVSELTHHYCMLDLLFRVTSHGTFAGERFELAKQSMAAFQCIETILIIYPADDPT